MSWTRYPLAALAFDLAALAFAWVFAVWLGRDFVLPPGAWADIGSSLLAILSVGLVAMLVTSSYRGLWRFVGVHDALRLAVVAQSVVFVGSISKLFVEWSAVRWSSGVIAGALFMALAMGARLMVRLAAEQAAQQDSQQRAIVLGSGDAAALLIRELQGAGEYRPVALLDDNPQRVGRKLLGVEVLGRIDDLPDVARRLQARVAIAAMPAAMASDDAAHQSHLRQLAASAGLRLMTVPPLGDLMLKRARITQLRELDAQDLLNRAPVDLASPELRRLVEGRRVLITGGGGSIGSELARQVASLRPERLDVLDHSEFNVYQIGERLQARCELGLHVADVRNEARLRQVLAQTRPHIVLHAAAYKHVPLMEEGNCSEAVQVNVGGTSRVATLAGEHGVERFVLVSTDKAVNPTNVMGATKRVAELAVQAAAVRFPNTVYVSVRFGNVLDSAGSVIPKFREQIAAGGPVTVTHPDIVRYFMSIPEAAQLVLTAASHAQGGEVFVLDMGEPVRIADLAREMVRLAGLTEDQIKIAFTGLRPGEKLFEELLVDTERHRATPHAKIFVAGSQAIPAGFSHQLDQLLQAVTAATTDRDVRLALQTLVPEYRPALGASPMRADERQADSATANLA
jgi:FlaA1/EpsC-like NDP-sugar epimerase